MSSRDAHLHVQGRAAFVDDDTRPDGLLFAAVHASPLAHGRIEHLDVSDALAQPGVVAVLTAQDIPGDPCFGAITADDRFLAADEVNYVGEPVALVIAESAHAARRARHKIKLELTPLAAIFDAREAFARGMTFGVPRTLSHGDIASAWPDCDVIVQGSCETGGQEHVYLETQRSRALPLEDGGLRIHSSTQGPSVVQRAVARMLGIAQNRVEVDVLRLGGGFGGKEDQATLWAGLAALGAWHTGRPVELVLNRSEDLAWTGKRHPYQADFKLGLRKDGAILAYEVEFYQNAGASTDLSPAILERSMLHAGNSYHIPNMRIFAVSCRTHLPSNTAFRGFGGPQAMFVLESAIDQAAATLGLSREQIQKQNLLRDGDVLPYGQILRLSRLTQCWDQLQEICNLPAQRARIENYNRLHPLQKKGLACMPICFGISFTTTFLNQAGALLHIYSDGSVAVSIGGVEMGQGLYDKVHEIARRALGIDPSRIRVHSTNTARVANISPTAASVSTDLYGFATLQAIDQVLDRLKAFLVQALHLQPDAEISIISERISADHKDAGWNWERLVAEAYQNRIDLSAHGFYATPEIGFDKAHEQGRPFRYHVQGVAAIEVTLDALRGVYSVDAVHIVHDLGRSLDLAIDRGQVEGALAQGLGWMLLEELAYDTQGRPLVNSLSRYKVPDIYFAPETLEIRFLQHETDTGGPFQSKAVGEPPFMYGIGAWFALADAMRAFRPQIVVPYRTPLTPERVLTALYSHCVHCDQGEEK